MRYLIFVLIFIPCLSSKLFAQKVGDVIYYDQHWKAIPAKDGASYFRTIDDVSNGITTVTDHYINGNPQMKGSYSAFNPDTKEGDFIFYNENGIITTREHYNAGKLNGKCQYFFADGKLHYECTRLNDNFEGDFTSYYSNGAIKRLDRYKNGELLSGKCYGKTGADTVYSPYMIQPMFKGGQDSLMNYIIRNLKYPSKARRNNITGRVQISFVVDKNGKLGDITVVKSIDPLLDNAAMAIVKTMPDWTPGIVDGEPEKFLYTQPFNFTLSDK